MMVIPIHPQYLAPIVEIIILDKSPQVMRYFFIFKPKLVGNGVSPSIIMEAMTH
jgi:hypothetical protein